jgi:Gpi18-like mannosyltransferase
MLTVVLRILYSAFAAASALLQPVNWRLVHSNALTENLLLPTHGLRYLLLGVWERFDTLWYLHIAVHGYDRPESVVFFPLYPGLIRSLSVAISPTAAALLISSVSAFFVFWGLQELLRTDYPAKVADRSMMLCAVWPASFIFFAGYAESLLLALIVWSLCVARRDRWAAAVALGLAAALTKAVGVVVVVPLLIMALRRRPMIMLATLLVPLGPFGYVGYLRWTGRGWLGAAYGQFWRTLMASPWSTFWAGVSTLVHAPNAILMMNLFFLMLVCALAALSRARMEYLLYAAVALGMALCKETTPPLQSMMRYVLIVFPAFAGLARWFDGPRGSSRFRLVCAVLFAVNLGLLWLFTGWSLVV